MSFITNITNSVVQTVTNSASACRRAVVVVTEYFHVLNAFDYRPLADRVTMTYCVNSEFVAKYRTSSAARDLLGLWQSLSLQTQIPAYCDVRLAESLEGLTAQFDAWINRHREAVNQVDKLWLSDFTNFPSQISQLIGLKELHIYRGEFTTLPTEVCSLPNLRELYIQDCDNLIFSSEIGGLTQLTHLLVAKYDGIALPAEIGLLQNLKTLNVAGITTVPAEIGQLYQLENLYLDSGTLTALPPEIGQLTNLTRLELKGNRLATLPAELGDLINLRSANFGYNQLTTIPDSLAALPWNCLIHFEGNPLSAEAIRAFENRIDAVSAEDANLGPQRVIFARTRAQVVNREETLEDAILFWLTKFKEAFPDASQESADRFPAQAGDRACLAFYNSLLTHEEKGKLHEFLNRLKKTKDYEAEGASRQKVIVDAVYMLQEAATQVKFREALFPILDDATSTCGDRVTLARNTIKMQICLSRADERSDAELAELVIGLKRMELLDGYAKERIDALNLGDAIETYLYYQVKLKDKLKLPIAADGMLYAEMSGITPAMLKEDAGKILNQTTSAQDVYNILINSTEWQKRMLKNHKAELDAAEGKLSEKMNELFADEEMPKGEQTKQMDALMLERKELTKVLVERHTQEWVAQNIK
ncbi:MAG TPA: NEL-type E3 ubiquitin ligase domain-containing protein [Rhabdochlamydiaceae bacterium]|nr:NEL-type E3 ubiquitin ligase domain-containing protein [Rhabdochlamydiaceae bacterium]